MGDDFVTVYGADDDANGAFAGDTNEYDISNGSITITATESGQTVKQGNTTNTVSADTYVVITGTMTQNAITIKADGGKTELVTLFNVDIQMSSGSAIKTTGQGAVTLELNGTNIAKSNTGGAGIQKMNTDWLVIQDNSTPDGSLTAAGGDYTAGIGGS
jgi:hypothetical protein